MFLHLHYNYENIEIMNNANKDIIWSTENLVMFGMWLVNKGEYGYGLLCVHGSCLGIKIGSLLKLTWGDFIEEGGVTFYPATDDSFPSKEELVINNDRKNEKITLELSSFIQNYTRQVFITEFDYYTSDLDANIYINIKTGKLLTTSSLNRELNKLYEQFRLEVYSMTYLELKFRELKTNTFEIAWGRDMVQKYNCTKKVFIAVSKYMGHRTVNDTIKLFELEPNDDIKISYDMFNPINLNKLGNLFNSKFKLGYYLLNNNLGQMTEEFIKRSRSLEDVWYNEEKFWDNF
jgi:hypothetical protein